MHEPQMTWVEVSRTGARRKAQEYALVLQAVGIAHGMAQDTGQHLLIVRLEDAERARAELEKYDRENVAWPPREEAPPMMSRGVNAAIVYGGILVLCYLAQRRESFGLDWWNAGCASATRILSGEWWRSITALCLHGDILHLAGNLVFGALFGVILAQSVGSGVAWFAFVITGGLGNVLNAFLQDPSHVSIGASTGVFGVLGVQVAVEWARRGQIRQNRFRRWAPIVMGAALFAWLGSGAQNIDHDQLPKNIDDLNVAIRRIDVWAHVFGFAAGLGLGAVLGLTRKRASSLARSQTAFAAAAIGLTAIAWFLAFR